MNYNGNNLLEIFDLLKCLQQSELAVCKLCNPKSV